MRLLRLHLVKCNRLYLNMINQIDFKPTAPTQFIIGSNGSGKSSLFGECSLLPPDKDDFDDGGSKLAIFERGKDVFTAEYLKNDGKWHHSFLKNGIELNESHGVTTQLQLIKDHTNYTPEIHQLIIGNLKFCSMSFAERRKWFTLLANSNYDYAIAVFKRVTEKYNENRHALKRSKERLVIEAAKLLPVEQLQELENQCSALYLEVQRMIEHRKPLMEPASNYIQKANNLAVDLKNTIKDVRSTIGKLVKGISRNAEELKELIAATSARIDALTQVGNQYFEDYERVQKLWDAMQTTKLENAAQINQQIVECDNIIAEATAACTYPVKITADAGTTIASCDKVLAWWPDAASGLRDSKDVVWGRDFLATANAAVEKSFGELSTVRVSIGKLEQTIEHMQAHQNESSVTCPKCSTSFQPNFSNLTLEDAKSKIATLRKTEEAITQRYEGEVQLKREVEAYLTHYRNVVQQLRNYPGLEEFADYIIRELILVKSPSSFTDHVHRIRDVAGHMGRISQAEAKREEVRRLAGELLTRGGSSDNIEEDRSRLEKLIGDNEHTKSELLTQLNTYKRQLSTIEYLKRIEQTLTDGQTSLDKAFYDANDSNQRAIYAEMLRELQSQLAFKEQALQAAERQISVIEHIESEIIDLEQGVADYKILVAELSPTEGLIAEGLFGFTRAAVDQMNQTVDMLFSYPLKIMPCATEGTSLNLNYKFPIDVNGKRRFDVSAGSAAMHEVFNLAFVIMAMKSMGIADYPLFLDEFGKALDPVHKQASISMLGSLMDYESFEQIFMISHDIIQYGSIGRSEICVLHEANVVLPPNCEYNKHVKIN